jgi:glycosyltransferase involved in cell wall biosynthesis
VIEGMAHGRAVVATPRSLRGIDAVAGRDFISAPATATAFASAVADLMVRPESAARIGTAARRVAEDRYSPAALRTALARELSKLLGARAPAVREYIVDGAGR